MMTTLERGSAATWADAGRSVAGGLGALFQGEAVRQKAKHDQEDLLAGIYAKNMQGNQYGANARKLAADAADQEFTTQLRQGVDAELVASPDMEPYERALRLAYKFAGPQHMQNWSNAAEREKRIADINAVQENPALAQATGLAYAATKGNPLYSAVGNTGVSLNQFTGQQATTSPELMDLFTRVQRSIWNENNAQAGSASASAANSRASADLTAAKLKHFMETGRFPGTEGSGEDATNAKTRNAVIASVERELGVYATEAEIVAEVDRRLARRNFTAPARTGAQPGRPATAAPPALDAVAADTAIAKARAAIQRGADPAAIQRGADPAAVKQRLAQAGIDPAQLNQARAPGAAAGPVVEAPRNPTDRVKGAVYSTPKGNMKWTGTGWVPAQ